MEYDMITSEALEVMGFEINASTKEYVMWASDEENHIGVILPAYDYPLSVTQYSGDTVVMELPHIRTLPQLRQLIRSLFGDESLPRRELATITDEEAIALCRILNKGTMELYQNNFPFLSVYKTDYLTVCKEKVLGDMHPTLVYFNLSEGNFCDYYDYDSKNNIAGYNYLTNTCDFHLPAFHE